MQIEELYKQFLHSTGISTDTRKIEKGKIFFALKGENFNANLFAEAALNKGADWVITDEKHFPDTDKIILVEDVLKTLQKLAHHHRKQLNARVIAIAGSNGKTTTKELVAAVLKTTYQTSSTQGNFNNHIGMPLTLLSISNDIEFAVIELGANHLHETELLCKIAEPDFGLITNNGKDHLEGYGDIEGVKKGNCELYDFLRKQKKPAFVSADQDELMKISEGMIRITYGKSPDADYRGEIESYFPFLDIILSASGIKIKTGLFGKYNFDNVMAAICIGKHFGIHEKDIQQAIKSYIPSNNRSQILDLGSNRFILDAYNSNPSSLRAAIENFSMMPVRNKVVIAGDMLELGSASEAEHVEIITFLNAQHFDKVILVGNNFGKALRKSKEGFIHFENVHDLKSWFIEQHFTDHYFLLKGSRLIALEKLLYQTE